MKRAYFSSSIEEFHNAEPDAILGDMALEHSFSLNNYQRDAWIEQTRILSNALIGLKGRIYLEFSVPRMGKRVDAVIIIDFAVFVIEFKVGARSYESADLDQVMDYVLDLQNFHEGSHKAVLVPILVATDAPTNNRLQERLLRGQELSNPIACNADDLKGVIASVLKLKSGKVINCSDWERSGYKPTPTIIEATLALYNGHSVNEITRSDAGAYNISKTTMAVDEIIKRSKSRSEKSIVFVTGVPGAGKTLVGLNIATKNINKKDELYSVYLSGNGPLVKILQEALARNKVSQGKENGEKIRKGEALSEVKAFIQNVHHFRDEGVIDMESPPIEHVVLFDEAQRAWTRDQTIKFMREKKSIPDFDQSEPEFLISCMDRHKDWATIVCLVGGGQEINTGEAGIAEWFKAIYRSFPHWKVYLSDQLNVSEYSGLGSGYNKNEYQSAKYISSLHLKTSVRSFRSDKVSSFVKHLLDKDISSARDELLSIGASYPIVLTRSFNVAKEWVREQARGTERYGMVVSSQAERLKPYAIDVRVKTNPVHWFLNDKSDVRSSYYLEEVGTEFDVQGLELDWVCMAWDADFRCSESGWENWSFRGSKWQRINKFQRKIYQKNAYRVLLTRARQGMILVVPEGDVDDVTRSPDFYDPTYEYLLRLGMNTI